MFRTDTQPRTQSRYQRLREDLERAYAAPVWNSQQIDQIADEIARIEWACAHRSGHVHSVMGCKAAEAA